MVAGCWARSEAVVAVVFSNSDGGLSGRRYPSAFACLHLLRCRLKAEPVAHVVVVFSFSHHSHRKRRMVAALAAIPPARLRLHRLALEYERPGHVAHLGWVLEGGLAVLEVVLALLLAQAAHTARAYGAVVHG